MDGPGIPFAGGVPRGRAPGRSGILRSSGIALRLLEARRLGARLGSDDADERDALTGRTAQIVRERELPAAGHARDLTLPRLATQLEPALVEHPEAGRADRVTERFQTAVGIDGQLSVEIERTREHFLPC